MGFLGVYFHVFLQAYEEHAISEANTATVVITVDPTAL
jgi:hypothetical protein